MTNTFKSVEDVYGVARLLRDRLAALGEDRAAKELDDTMANFWTTASEALGEIKLSLLQVRPVVEKALGTDDLKLLDSAVSGTTSLWNEGS